MLVGIHSSPLRSLSACISLNLSLFLSLYFSLRVCLYVSLFSLVCVRLPACAFLSVSFFSFYNSFTTKTTSYPKVLHTI